MAIIVMCQVNEALLTLDKLQLSPKQCKLCGAQLLIAHPSWGGCWNKSYMGSGPDSPFRRESGYARLIVVVVSILLAFSSDIHAVIDKMLCSYFKLLDLVYFLRG